MAIPGLTRTGADVLPALLAEAPAWPLIADDIVTAGYESVTGLADVWPAVERYAGNPAVTAPGGANASFANALYDASAGVYRLWCQTHDAADASDRWIGAYESADGLTWTASDVGGGSNIAVANPGSFARGGYVIPVRDLRPYHRFPSSVYRWRFAMVVGYDTSTNPAETVLYLSNDGLAWSGPVEMISDFNRDTYQVVEPAPGGTNWYVYTRPTLDGPALPTDGQEYQMAYLAGTKLLGGYGDPANDDPEPTLLLTPDATDIAMGSRKFYGSAPWRYRGTWLGWLWLFLDVTGYGGLIKGQLIWSRDGVTWNRRAASGGVRPVDLDVGTSGAWDDGMVFPVMRPLSIGDYWYMPYAGWDGGHDDVGRVGLVGFARVTRGRLRGHQGDGTAPARRYGPLSWPAAGGSLYANAAAAGGQIRFRVLDSGASELLGYGDTTACTTDAVSHVVADLSAYAGQSVYVEAEITSATLYEFRAIE
jgi:hypothetical protein